MSISLGEKLLKKIKGSTTRSLENFLRYSAIKVVCVMAYGDKCQQKRFVVVLFVSVKVNNNIFTKGAINIKKKILFKVNWNKR